MAARIYPADAVGAQPAYTGRALRQAAVAPFVALGSTARPLGGLSGVRPGTPSTIGSVTPTTWTVNPIAGVLDGETLAIAGPYTYAFDTAQTGAVSPATSTARTDRLDVQINDSAESDGTPTTTPAYAVIIYTQGVSTATPAAPPRSHPLYLINVPATGGGSPTLTWNASFTASAGGYAEFLTWAALQLWTTAPLGQHATVLNDPTPSLNGDYVSTGSGWVAAAFALPATFSAHVTGTPTINSGWNLITSWGAPDFMRNFTFAGGALTVNQAGIYDVAAEVATSASGATSLQVTKNSAVADTNRILKVQQTGLTVFGIAPVSLAAGDVLRLFGAGPTASQTLGTDSFLAVNFKSAR